MTKKWTPIQEKLKHKELEDLYIKDNKSITEIAKILTLSQSTVYDRLLRLKIQPIRSKKPGFNNKRLDIYIPKVYSKELAEFVGVMLGDGHLTNFQVTITLGDKEKAYVDYLCRLIKKLFKIEPKIIKIKEKYYVLYFGSTEVVHWLFSMGLVLNKVKSQVGVPGWIFSGKDYIESFLRGFFDTDGSVYKLKFGVQLAFTNRSLPLLKGVQKGLLLVGYHPSKISLFRTYLTRKKEVIRFFKEVVPANLKHRNRFYLLTTLG